MCFNAQDLIEFRTGGDLQHLNLTERSMLKLEKHLPLLHPSSSPPRPFPRNLSIQLLRRVVLAVAFAEFLPPGICWYI